ncbi:hypothetical protein L5515_013217 [Caenorhabditis briggsae]|uniref:Uncharacterized protein n=1 Tax=Caenorhabditis briggsae TaxID=6238 RepID=A0AAE9E7K3_CAEBR|nr:hypothetical protein L5515_013217 [Caenorhabditis briggsae]
MYIYWILLLAVSVTCDPFLIPLKGKEGPGIYTIYNVEGGGKLYLASNDANESLNKITLVTGTVNITLDQLNDFSDTPKFITVSDKVVLSNQNLDDVTDALTGYLYITTKQQADDPNFSVAVIKTNHTIVTTNTNSTVVILNTALISDSDEIDKPLKTSFNDIEPLQINQDYWYLKSSGPLTMNIENKFVRTLNYTTTSFDTTGLIVNNDVFLEHTVNFILDPTRERDAGVIVSTFIESNDTLIEFRLLDENGGEIEMNAAKGQSFIHEQMDALDPVKFLVVNSTSIHPGVFYCQYYGFQGDLLPKTTMRPTTSMTPSTVISTTVPTVSTVIPISSAPVFSTTVSVPPSTQTTTVTSSAPLSSTPFTQPTTSGSKLYLASNDANESLKKITLVTGTVNITDTPKFIKVSDRVVLSNQNSVAVNDALTGYLYITTKQQADDPNFSVAVIKTNHTIVTTDTNSTVVILNTALISDSDEIDKPLKTSRVTDIKQSANAEFDFHWGIPANNWTKVVRNKFFENPFIAVDCYSGGKCTLYKKTIYHIEPLQINQDYWYLKSSGPLTMTIENKFVPTLNYTTTAFETTGLIVNNDVFLQHTVNFVFDPTKKGHSGLIVSTFIESDNTYLEFNLTDRNGGNTGGGMRHVFFPNVKNSSIRT